MLGYTKKCLDLDVKCSENGRWLYNCFMFFYPFYGQFGRGGPILLAIRERRCQFIEQIWEEVCGAFYSCPKLCWLLGEVSFYCQSSIWRAGSLDQVILLVWPYGRDDSNFSGFLVVFVKY